MNIFLGKNNRSLTWKTIFYILLFSSFFTILASALQLYQSYQEDIGLIGARMDLIQQRYLDSLSTSVWEVDKEQIEIQLKGILSLSDIQFVNLQERTQELSFTMGTTNTEKTITRKFPLEYSLDEIEPIFLGDLIVVATLANAYQRTLNKLFLILATQAVKTFCVSFGILYIIYYLITRHLTAIAHYSRSLNLNNLETPLLLNRKPQGNGHQDELGQVVHSLNEMRRGLKNEIAEREKIGVKLLGQEEQFRKAVTLSPLPLMIHSEDGNVIFINEVWKELTGYTEQDIPTIAEWTEKAYGERKEAVKEDISKLYKLNQRIDEGSYNVTAKDGRTLIWDFCSAPLGKMIDGKMLVICKAKDVTEQVAGEKERKKLINRLNQANKMESIGNLAGGIAHDFNNILSAVLGFSELALDEVEKGTTMEGNLREIYAGGLRAKEIVNQILAFARQSDEEKKPTRVDVIIVEALKLISPSTPSTIEIRKNIESSSLVNGNTTQIHQIIMNLCTNAAHAMQDDGGIMEVTLKDVLLGENSSIPAGLEKGKYIELAISDNGSGIEAEHIDSIFDPYFTTKETGKGTGMGLAMVRGIVESYGGTILVESSPSVKTIFTIYLPITSNRENEITFKNKTLPEGDEHILFVDDEPPIARMGSRILESLGYQVTTRTSSIEALELFKAKPDDFQLVITDMTMPYMTGDQFSIELKKIRGDILIILCTGHSNKINAGIAQDIGINAFTYKPFSKADLADCVREVLDNA
ncbi:MAG: PAS domain S-box-containing protein [Desulforhopalus sp.]|jgi:PAS domain S-box-containing protein